MSALLAAALIAACATGPTLDASPSFQAGLQTPSAAATVGAQASAVPPTEQPVPTSGAAAECAGMGLVISPAFVPGAIDAHVGLGTHIALSTERAASVADPSLVWPGGYDYGEGLPDLIRIRAGSDVEVRLELDYDFDFDWPLQVAAVKAVLRVPGERRRPLDARIAGPDQPGTVLLTIPDRNVDGALELEVEASDRCIVYTATGKGNVRIARGAMVDACPVDTDGAIRHWATLNEPPVQAEGIPVELSLTEFAFAWTPGAFGSQGNDGLSEFDPAASTAIGARGGTLSVAAANSDLQIRSISVQFFRRGAVLNWLDGGTRPSHVFEASATPLGDGSLDVLLPSNEGRYAAAVSVQWESGCARGGAVGPIGIDVQ
jgi:hypothetical protein